MSQFISNLRNGDRWLLSYSLVSLVTEHLELEVAHTAQEGSDWPHIWSMQDFNSTINCNDLYNFQDRSTLFNLTFTLSCLAHCVASNATMASTMAACMRGNMYAQLARDGVRLPDWIGRERCDSHNHTTAHPAWVCEQPPKTILCIY